MQPGSSPLRIGVAACFFHADPARAAFPGKTLLYLLEPLTRWLMGAGAVPYLIPTPHGGVDANALIAGVDGLVLQGGSDVAPQSYGDAPRRPEWAGDPVRDRYEIELIRAGMALDRPVLGLCRGLQIVNVALGGSLHQDLAAECPGALVHRDATRYDRLEHDIVFESGSRLEAMYRGRSGGRINSVHHQGIKNLGTGLRVEARSVPDGIIEAVRYEEAPFVYAVQWHPEFQEPANRSLLPADPIRDLFLGAVAERAACR